MKYQLKFDIPPVQQIRPRSSVRMYRHHLGINVRDPQKVKDFKALVAYIALTQFKRKPLEGQLKVEISFFRTVQNSLSKKERAKRLLGIHRPVVKPDLSNYIKSMEDGLNGIVWKDDNQIVDLIAHKYYSEDPHIELSVEELAEDVKNVTVVV